MQSRKSRTFVYSKSQMGPQIELPIRGIHFAQLQSVLVADDDQVCEWEAVEQLAFGLWFEGEEGNGGTVVLGPPVETYPNVCQFEGTEPYLATGVIAKLGQRADLKIGSMKEKEMFNNEKARKHTIEKMAEKHRKADIRTSREL